VPDLSPTGAWGMAFNSPLYASGTVALPPVLGVNVGAAVTSRAGRPLGDDEETRHIDYVRKATPSAFHLDKSRGRLGGQIGGAVSIDGCGHL
jgi:hypothetical protein